MNAAEGEPAYAEGEPAFFWRFGSAAAAEAQQVMAARQEALPEEARADDASSPAAIRARAVERDRVARVERDISADERDQRE